MDELKNELRSLNNAPQVFHVKCESNDEFTFTGRPCELSAFSYVPENRKYEPSSRSIYNAKTHTFEGDILTYDRLFKVDYNFNNKVHRDDRKHAKLRGLDAWSEEIQKVIPTRSASEYGKKIVNIKQPITAPPVEVTYSDKLDPPQRKHVRIAKVKSEFYNRNGINDLSDDKLTNKKSN